MLARKIEALERRLVKTMAKNEDTKKRWEKPYAFIKAALDAVNEDDHQTALENMQKFNSLMQEYKLNLNV